MSTKKNPFDVFKHNEVKTAHIEALGATIKYRELTIGENDAFNSKLIKAYDPDTGKPEFDLSAAAELKYDKVAAMLVEPKMTVDELRQLPQSASKAIDEIMALVIDESDVVDNEGN